jgi:HSP20 family molecular chaperone IbpA
LDRFDSNWRDDPFWRDLYPRWAEPIFKDGIDVKTSITNDSNKFAVEIDSYQFRPEELQVKTMDDTLLIEGRHEDVRDRDNYTKMVGAICHSC